MIWYFLSFVAGIIIVEWFDFEYDLIFILVYFSLFIIIFYIRNSIKEKQKQQIEDMRNDFEAMVDNHIEEMFDSMYESFMADYYDDLHLTYDMLIVDYDDDFLDELENRDDIVFRKALRASIRQPLHDHLIRVYSNSGYLTKERQNELTDRFKSEFFSAAADALEVEIQRRLVRNHKLLVDIRNEKDTE